MKIFLTVFFIGASNQCWWIFRPDPPGRLLEPAFKCGWNIEHPGTWECLKSIAFLHTSACYVMLLITGIKNAY